MAKTRPAKVTLLKCLYPIIDPVATFEPASFDDAIEAVIFFNNRIVAAGRDNSHEFYFLNARIEGATKIITKRDMDDYPSSDREIVAKLKVYLEGEAAQNTGTPHSRGKNKRYK